MPKQHPGFPAAGLTFLTQLSRNNTTAWFQAHRATYDESVKAPFIALVTALNDELGTFAPNYRAKSPKSVSRPNRDTRFSKDKSPYKTDISIVLPFRGKEKAEAAGFFLRVRRDGADIIGGSVVPEPPQLKRIRDHLMANHTQARRLLGNATLTRLCGELRGERLARPPKGYPETHPAVELLKHKQFYFERALDAKVVASPRFLPEVIQTMRAMTPWVEFLDTALGNRRS